MNVMISDNKKASKKIQSSGFMRNAVATPTAVQASSSSKSTEKRSKVLTQEWQKRRKSILLNPAGASKLNLTMLIHGGRK